MFARSASKLLAESRASTQIETGTQDLAVSVTVVYEIA